MGRYKGDTQQHYGGGTGEIHNNTVRGVQGRYITHNNTVGGTGEIHNNTVGGGGTGEIHNNTVGGGYREQHNNTVGGRYRGDTQQHCGGGGHYTLGAIHLKYLADQCRLFQRLG